MGICPIRCHFSFIPHYSLISSTADSDLIRYSIASSAAAPFNNIANHFERRISGTDKDGPWQKQSLIHTQHLKIIACTLHTFQSHDNTLARSVQFHPKHPHPGCVSSGQSLTHSLVRSFGGTGLVLLLLLSDILSLSVSVSGLPTKALCAQSLVR